MRKSADCMMLHIYIKMWRIIIGMKCTWKIPCGIKEVILLRITYNLKSHNTIVMIWYNCKHQFIIIRNKILVNLFQWRLRGQHGINGQLAVKYVTLVLHIAIDNVQVATLKAKLTSLRRLLNTGVTVIVQETPENKKIATHIIVVVSTNLDHLVQLILERGNI